MHEVHRGTVYYRETSRILFDTIKQSSERVRGARDAR